MNETLKWVKKWFDRYHNSMSEQASGELGIFIAKSNLDEEGFMVSTVGEWWKLQARPETPIRVSNWEPLKNILHVEGMLYEYDGLDAQGNPTRVPISRDESIAWKEEDLEADGNPDSGADVPNKKKTSGAKNPV